jgi:glycosyltransferase involved in cell wall biosynthesis
MRALINVISVKYGGSFTDTYNILKGLAALGKTDEYYFFISKSAKDKLPVLPSNFHALTFPAAERSWPVHFIYGQLFLPVFVLLKRIDVMLSFNFASFLAPCPQIIRITQPVCFSAIVAKKMKILGFVYAFRMFVYRNLILLSVKKADKVIFISEALKDDIAGFTRMDLRPERYIVSYNGLDKGFVEAKQAAGGPGEMPADGTFKLLYPSFYYFHKNFPLLFEAMAELRKKGIDNVKLMLTIHPEDIPPRDREGILKTLEENGLSSHVIFTGSLPYEDMP